MHLLTRRQPITRKFFIIIFANMFLLLHLNFAQVSGQDLAKLDPRQTKSLVDQLSEHLNESGVKPTDYIVSKFQDHDVILLGEIHEIKEHCELVCALIEPLHAAGIQILFSEFIPTRFNDQIKSIVEAEEFDRAAVVEIFRQRPSPLWGFKEYIDIVEAVWKFNRTLDGNQKKFSIVGLENDWSEAKLLEASRGDRFNMIMAREKHMTKIIRKHALEQNQKGLVHIGYAHTVRHGVRVAAEIEKSHPGKIFQVACHHEMAEPGGPSRFTRLLEGAFKQSQSGAIGFDVTNSSFAELVDTQAIGFKRLGSKATLQNFAEGYVFLKPVDQLTKVSWIDGFITERTFADALVIAKKKGWLNEQTPSSAEELDQIISRRFNQ